MPGPYEPPRAIKKVGKTDPLRRGGFRSWSQHGDVPESTERGVGRGPAQDLARPGVDPVGDLAQVSSRVHGQVRALGKVLTQQPVGVLVGRALPGRMRMTEV